MAKVGSRKAEEVCEHVDIPNLATTAIVSSSVSREVWGMDEVALQ